MSVLNKTLLYLGALLLFFVCTAPFILSFVGSIVPQRALLALPPDWFSEGASLDHYIYVFTGKVPQVYAETGSKAILLSEAPLQVPRSMVNSSIVALAVMVINIVFGAPAAYAFARIPFRGKMPTFMVIMFSRLVPAVALAVPFYLLIQGLGLLGSKLALILVHTVQTIPLTVFILSVFFRRLPKELEDAALVDGCNVFQAFYRVVLRMSGASIFATGLFAFILSYSEFQFAAVLSGEGSQRPLSVTLGGVVQMLDASFAMMNTSIFLAILPTLVLVVFVWRLVVERIVEGGVQG